MESVDLTTSEVTTYDWDDNGRLITTTVGSNVTRVYQYSQDGDLLQADVDGLVTTFAYDGNGQRLQLSIAGEATTFLPDYSGRSNRVLFEQGTAETKQYLYGVACLGEYVTDNATSESEWRYYQRDGATLVRQTTNQTATITLAWTFSPEGGVVLGEEGPVTHLGCQDDAVYDWSTGLIFKSGRYFDPSLGIWLTGPAMILLSSWLPRKRRKGKKGKRNRSEYFIWLLVLLLVTVPLTGCKKNETPQPTETDEACGPESETPVPGQPSKASNPIAPTETATPTGTSTTTPTGTSTSTPTGTSTSTPTGTSTSTPTPSKPMIWTQLPLENPLSIQWYGNTVFAYDSTYNKDNKYGYESFADGFHSGIDLIGSPGTKVKARMYGDVVNIYDYNNLDREGPKFYTDPNKQHQADGYRPSRIDIKDRNTGQNVLFGHLRNIPLDLGTKEITPETELGEVDPNADNHVHLEVWTGDIVQWGPMTNPLPYFPATVQSQLIAIAKSQNDPRVTFFQNQSNTVPDFLLNIYTQPDIKRQRGRYLERFGYVLPSTPTPVP